MVQDSLGCLCPGLILILYYRRTCKAHCWGVLSGTGLLWLDRDDKESNLFWMSREDEVSIKVVEKSDIQDFIRSHTMLLPEDLLRMQYIVEELP